MKYREFHIKGLIIQLDNTNLSYCLRICTQRHNGIQWDWWYVPGASKRWWMPLEFRFWYFEIKRIRKSWEKRKATE